MGTKYLEEEDEMINRMSNEGDTPSEIARVLNYNFGRNRTESGVARRIQTIKRIPRPKTKRKYEKYSDAEIRAIIDLDAVGMTRKQIAETVSTSFNVDRSDTDIAQKIGQIKAKPSESTISDLPKKYQQEYEIYEENTTNPAISSCQLWSDEEILFVKKFIKRHSLVQPLRTQRESITKLTTLYNNKFGSFRSEAAMYSRVYLLTDRPKKKKKSLLRRWREWRVRRIQTKMEKLRRKL
jgi:hypothetical protein